MTKARAGNAFMPADEYGHSLPKFSANLLVRNVAMSLPFTSIFSASLSATRTTISPLFPWLGIDFMLHAHHANDHHPLDAPLMAARERGVGAELRLLGVDPDQVEARAKRVGTRIVQRTKDFVRGWREITLLDPDGYIWTVGPSLPSIR